MILLRHGQSEFNLHFTATRRDPGIKDPKLTDLGHQQAEQAAETLLAETSGDIRRIVASPYTRAMQTAAPLARKLGLPVTIQPLVRERYAFACDIGTPRTTLALEWPDHDLAHIDEVWWPAIEEPADQVEGPRPAVPAGDGGAGGLGPHRGRLPLGLYSVHDRAVGGQRPVAALRPDRPGTREHFLEASLTAARGRATPRA
jgi:hypothetical protein